MARKKHVTRSRPDQITYEKWKLSRWVVTYSVLGFILFYLVYFFIDNSKF